MGLPRVGPRLVTALWVGLALNAKLASAQPPPSPAGWGLPQLMQTLAQVKSATAQFTERKTVHMLTAPLATSGTLTYVAPNHMEKITLSPAPERFALDGDQVTIASGPQNETHIFSVTDYPQIGGLIEGIRATLAGDLPALNRFYAVQLSGSPSNWQLLLQPKDSELTHFIKWVRILGSDGHIREIKSEESDGDQSDMTIVEHARDDR
jgi:outer membrane lipoprotein carrier protein LolA